MAELRVAIVDDEQAIRDGLAMILGAHRDLAVVGSAADGAEALDLCARQTPDVVLLDLRMPGTDGLTFLGVPGHQVGGRRLRGGFPPSALWRR